MSRQKFTAKRSQIKTALRLIFRNVPLQSLLGNDPVSGKNNDHRKVMIENQLQRLAGEFGIDLLGFAIMSNHFYLR